MVLLTLALSAQAEPEVRVEPDGEVVGVTVIEATPADVRNVLASASTIGELSPDVLDVTTEAEGRCVRVDRKTKGLFRPLRLFARRCPTQRGWREELIEPGDFATYSSEWIVVPDGNGTRVEYRVETTLDLPVPGSAVRAGLVRSTRTMLQNLIRRVTRPAPR